MTTEKAMLPAIIPFANNAGDYTALLPADYAVFVTEDGDDLLADERMYLAKLPPHEWAKHPFQAVMWDRDQFQVRAMYLGFDRHGIHLLPLEWDAQHRMDWYIPVNKEQTVQEINGTKHAVLQDGVYYFYHDHPSSHHNYEAALRGYIHQQYHGRMHEVGTDRDKLQFARFAQDVVAQAVSDHRARHLGAYVRNEAGHNIKTDARLASVEVQTTWQTDKPDSLRPIQRYVTTVIDDMGLPTIVTPTEARLAAEAKAKAEAEDSGSSG